MLKYFFFFIAISAVSVVKAQQSASYKEFTKAYFTYPFSDPDPTPPSKKIYPYYRFDGFTENGIMTEWKVIELENDFIKVQIMPEIGGKIWTAQEKKTGRHFLYNNEVVKFRDIALRGPWVSGGIESNFGIIGHTPNTATPVDYLVKNNEDGSVSCYLSTLDLLTRTEWVLEIRLEKDKAYFSTESFWFNSTSKEKPYYTWMNAAVPARDDLQFLFSGSHSLGHGGEIREWPMDSSGNDLSYYSQNDFGGSKSYHIVGSHSNFFGAFWKSEDFGMIHYSKREEKLGKKIFLWAQSGQGAIWEDLLTDDNGQYVEIQSGRLFNQNQFDSSLTPFKQIGFSPYSSQSWTEHWYPFMGIDGFTHANMVGAFHIELTDERLSVKISPVQPLEDTLKVYSEQDKLLTSMFVEGAPLEEVELKISLPAGEEVSYITIKGARVQIGEGKEKKDLSRPMEIAKDFDAESGYGLYLQGRDLANFRMYERAEEKIRASLSKNPLFIPSLVEMAKIKLFRIQNDSAFYYSKKALSIDTYNGEANYYYGLSASKLDQFYDALDGFEVAILDSEFRNPSYTELSHLYLKRNDFVLAEEYAQKALGNNQDNVDALQVLYLIGRIQGDESLLQQTRHRIKAINPLNHFIRFESYYDSQSEKDKENFTALIRNEMPIETYLELAIWYANIGRLRESKTVLKLSPQNAETLYWQAWLNKDENPERAYELLTEAEKSSPAFVFPFRKETAIVLEWASAKTESWKADYFLALIHDFRGSREKALSLVDNYDNNIDFAPFYALKVRLDEEAALATKKEYIENAVRLEPKEWRYARMLANTLIQLQKEKEAIQVLEKYYKADKTNYVVGLELIKAYIRGNHYQKAEKVLKSIHVLPFEGATGSRKIYRETKLMLAYEAFKKNNYRKVLQKIGEAEEWPRTLGVGKPYPEQIDNDLENAMRALAYREMNNTLLYEKYQEQVENKKLLEEEFLNEKIKSISSDTDQRIF